MRRFLSIALGGLLIAGAGGCTDFLTKDGVGSDKDPNNAREATRDQLDREYGKIAGKADHERQRAADRLDDGNDAVLEQRLWRVDKFELIQDRLGLADQILVHAGFQSFREFMEIISPNVLAMRLGDRASAKRLLNRSLELNGRSEVAQDARRLVTKLR